MAKLVAAIVTVVAACGCQERQNVTGPTPSLAAPSPLVPLVPVMRGRVVDYQTQIGLAGVVIRFDTNPPSGAGGHAVTDSEGWYRMTPPPVGLYTILVNDIIAGTGRPTGTNYRGDLLVDQRTCVARYGAVADAQTLQPAAGAAITLGSVTTNSGPDGWYRIDLGCPVSGSLGFNTTFLRASHPNYSSQDLVVGRGIQTVRRLDVHLQPR